MSRYGERTRVSEAVSALGHKPSGNSYGVATGGTSSPIIDSTVSYTLLTFVTDGTLTITRGGLFDVMVVGGGGASGGNNDYGGEGTGGGGGGSAFITTLFLSVGTFTVDVGAGGVAGVGGEVPTIQNGRPSCLFNSTTVTSFALAEGGGGGAGAWTSNLNQPLNVGGSSFRSGYSGGAAFTSQSPLCFAGGAAGSLGTGTAGGGAGAGGAASVATAGVGRTTTFAGSSVTYGSGGGGGTNAAAGATGSAIGGGGGGRQTGTTGNGFIGNAGAVYVRFR